MITQKDIYDLVVANTDTINYGDLGCFSRLVDKLNREGLLYEYGQVRDYDGKKKPYRLFGMEVREDKSIPTNEIHFKCHDRTLLCYTFPAPEDEIAAESG